MLSITKIIHLIIVCDLECGHVCFVYIHPQISSAVRNMFFELFGYLSAKPNFLSIIGDLNIRSDGTYASKLNEILRRKDLCCAFTKVTHN